MGKEDLTLRLRVTGNIAEAEQLLNRLGGGIRNLTAAGGGVFNILGRGVSIFTAPLRLATGAVIGLGAALTGFSAIAVKAAAEDQLLESRLTALYGSAKKAQTVFAGIENMSLSVPFDPEQLTQAHFVLQQLGLGGAKALRTVADAAAASGQSVDSMADAMASMSARTFKKFGIDIDSKDGGFVISFKDKMGRIKQIAAKDSDEARRSLLSIMGDKFGGGVGGLLTQLKLIGNAFSKGFGQFGSGLLPAVEQVATKFGDAFRKVIASGKLEELGGKLGAKLQVGADMFGAAVDRLPKLIEQIQSVWSKGPDAVGRVLMIAMDAGAQILTTLFLEGIGASIDIWKLIGKVLGDAFVDVMRSTGGLVGKMFGAGAKPGRGNLNLIEDNPGTSARNIVLETIGKLGGRAATIRASAGAEMSKVLGGIYSESFGAPTEEAAPQRYQIYRYRAGDNARTEGAFSAPAGKFKVGDRGRGGAVIINISNLQVRADRPREISNQMLLAVAEYAPSIATA